MDGCKGGVLDVPREHALCVLTFIDVVASFVAIDSFVPGTVVKRRRIPILQYAKPLSKP